MNSDTFLLTISTSNDAFSTNSNAELSHILRDLADKLDAGYTQFPILLDSNGNNVGSAKFY